MRSKLPSKTTKWICFSFRVFLPSSNITCKIYTGNLYYPGKDWCLGVEDKIISRHHVVNDRSMYLYMHIRTTVQVEIAMCIRPQRPRACNFHSTVFQSSMRKKVLASWLSVANEHRETCDSILVTNHQRKPAYCSSDYTKKVPNANHREKVNVVM